VKINGASIWHEEKPSQKKKQPAILIPPRWHATAQSSSDCWIYASNLLPCSIDRVLKENTFLKEKKINTIASQKVPP
jgi:hypothetical protein